MLSAAFVIGTLRGKCLWVGVAVAKVIVPDKRVFRKLLFLFLHKTYCSTQWNQPGNRRSSNFPQDLVEKK